MINQFNLILNYEAVNNYPYNSTMYIFVKYELLVLMQRIRGAAGAYGKFTVISKENNSMNSTTTGGVNPATYAAYGF